MIQIVDIDFGWEYPNRQSIEVTQHFITAAMSILPFNDENGSPTSDVSGFADVFDHIQIMNNDVWGSWSSAVGPNTPLNDICSASENQQGTAVNTVAAWTAAGMPVSEVMPGVASYRHAFTVNSSDAPSGDELATYTPFSGPASGDSWAYSAGTDVRGNYQPAGNTWNLWSLVDVTVCQENLEVGVLG
ncbi:hypothetical protein ACEPAI_7401 [Sanghuangporus weigelae]